MIRRTTIELDEELVSAASIALNQPTIRATVEESLRIAIDTTNVANRKRREKQVGAMKRLSKLIDSEVLMSEEAWR